MSERSAAHATFVIIRDYPASPGRVFKAFSDPEVKALWFEGGENWTLEEREMDFREGGRERSRGRWSNGMTSDFRCIYLDIVPDERIVFAYDMYVNDAKISVSLTTVEIKPEGSGTRMTFTEQDVFLDGFDDAGGRERGTAELLDRLGEALAMQPQEA
jgi:uncharacterized protein YndB with AHSA1/START domain